MKVFAYYILSELGLGLGYGRQDGQMCNTGPV